MWVCDIIINLAVITIVIMLGLYIISGLVAGWLAEWITNKILGL